MQIFISGQNGAATAYSVDADASNESLNLMIENKEFVPSHLIRLTHGGLDVEGGSLLGHGVQDEDTLTMLLDVNGGFCFASCRCSRAINVNSRVLLIINSF
jgi:hypothetical protein